MLTSRRARAAHVLAFTCLASVAGSTATVAAPPASPLGSTPAWTAESNQVSGRFGAAVSAAGDVDGDGFGDLLVVADLYDGGNPQEGRVSLYRGTATGAAAAPAWTFEANQDSVRLGAALCAGDVNGDGYADVIVGGSSFDAGQQDEGRAWLFLGSASGLAATAAWTAEANQVGAKFGTSVAFAGDVNGDGYGDVVIGAPSFDAGELNEGRAYLYLGGPSGLAATAAWTAEANQIGAQFGAAVAAAGDVDHDGYADVVIGAPNYDAALTDAGRAYVYLGSASGLAASPAWTADGTTANGGFGSAVAGIGDVTLDTYADIAIGEPSATNPEVREGRVFVFYGSGAGPAASAAWSAESDQAQSSFGASLCSAGDVDADGYPDLLIGANRYDDPDDAEGRAVLYRGSATGLHTTADWAAEGNLANARFGMSVSGAGDVNGDGFSDVVIGASLYSNGETSEGRAFLYLGAPAMPDTVATWSLAGAKLTSMGVASVFADFNGDGLSDLAVAESGYEYVFGSEGRIYMYLGSFTGLPVTPTISFSSFNPDVRQLGATMAAGSDLDGDGRADLLVGSPSTSHPDSSVSSAVFLLSGADVFFAPDLTHSIDLGLNSAYGLDLACVGDVNGDGYGDFVIGNDAYSGSDTHEGRALLYLGAPGFFSALSHTPAWTIEGNLADAHLGLRVRGLGDVNGDGYSDVGVASLNYGGGPTNAGKLAVYYGSPSGLPATPSWELLGTDVEGHFPSDVCNAGDVDGDTYSDLLIGDNLYFPTGRALLYRGSRTGLAASPSWTVAGPSDTQIGATVASAGDVNADGYSDFLVGSPFTTSSPFGAGKAFLYLGRPSLPETTPAWTLRGTKSNQGIGWRLAGGGDVEGDGFADFVVAENDTSGSNKVIGRVSLYHGNQRGGAGHWTRQRSALSASTLVAPLGLAGSSSSVHLSVYARLPFGRWPSALQWQVAPRRTTFAALPVSSLAFADPVSTIYEPLVSGLFGGEVYHWRSRVASTWPYAPHTPWCGLSDNGAGEGDFRTNGPVAIAAPPASAPALRVLPGQRLGVSLARAGWTRLTLVDTRGRLRATLIDGWRDAGSILLSLPSSVRGTHTMLFAQLTSASGTAVARVVPFDLAP